MRGIQFYKWSPRFKWVLMLRRMRSQREEVLGYELTAFCWVIRYFK